MDLTGKLQTLDADGAEVEQPANTSRKCLRRRKKGNCELLKGNHPTIEYDFESGTSYLAPVRLSVSLENWFIYCREDFVPIVLTTVGYGKGLMEFSSIE